MSFVEVFLFQHTLWFPSLWWISKMATAVYPKTLEVSQ